MTKPNNYAKMTSHRTLTLTDNRTERRGLEMAKNLRAAQARINELFTKAFGKTPLSLRLEDIGREANELLRYTGVDNLREEAGDLLASVLQLITECGWNAAELLLENEKKIIRRLPQYGTLGRKINVALLGGAFDPVTVGHIQTAQFVLNSSRTFDEVWLVPCFRHMNNKRLTSAEQRLAMCRLACEADLRLKVFDYEIANQLSGETFHLVQRLLGEQMAKDQYDFSIIFGLDNANTFADWVNFEHLERLIRFVIVPRAGVAPLAGVNWYLKPPHIYLAAEKNPITEISSTRVRELLRRNSKQAAKFLNPKVLDYIRANRLYGIKA